MISTYLQVIINKWKISFFFPFSRFFKNICAMILGEYVKRKRGRRYWIVTITKPNTHPTNINKKKNIPALL